MQLCLQIYMYHNNLAIFFATICAQKMKLKIRQIDVVIAVLFAILHIPQEFNKFFAYFITGQMESEIVIAELMDTCDLLTCEKRNAKALVCPRCESKILPAKTGVYVDDIEKDLHVMHKKQEDAGVKKEKFKQFYVVNDMFDFDNIGFTKSVDNDSIKYLICADCEVGPIGWHCISTKKNYVALARVKHI